MKRLSIFFLLFLSVTMLFVTSGTAQEKVSLTGKVTDNTGFGLPGVSILKREQQTER